jgi:amino acid adenylation domain-containing protein
VSCGRIAETALTWYDAYSRPIRVPGSLESKETVRHRRLIVRPHNKQLAKFPPEQQASWEKCFHPTGAFVEFPIEDVETSIPARFEKIVRLHPKSLAIKHKARSLSYEALNQLANRIARAILFTRGMGSEPVALLFDYGVDVIASLMAVLKAGKFYVALDPAFPPDRNAYIFRNTDANLLVTNDACAGAARDLAAESGAAILNIDHIDGSTAEENLNIVVSPDDVMTLTYTSGSTGTPKGVVETHRCRLHNTMLHSSAAQVSNEDRLAVIYSIRIQINLLRALLNGACVLPFDIKSESSEAFAKWLSDEQITILHLPVAAFRQFAQALTSDFELPHLRVIHLSGAPITQIEFELYKNRFADNTLFAYHLGAAETGGVCGGFLDRSSSFPRHGTPAGYQYREKEVVLLGEDGAAVKPGEIGEIAVKSRYLARGYWNMPELSKSKFLPSTSADERTYLTGDIGSMLPDGLIVHHGRKDSMVKVRGFSVELAEIEKALRTHPELRDVVVVARGNAAGEMSLVAYLVSETSGSPSVDDLRIFLKTKLPDYMIPSVFVALDSLPLVNGKVDRTALPRPDKDRPTLSQPYIAPQGSVEQLLVEIWESILQVRPVGTRDNFFDLGGDSLAGSRVISRIIREFHLELPVKALFLAPTVGELAAIVSQLRLRCASADRIDELLHELEAITEEQAQSRIARLKANSR